MGTLRPHKTAIASHIKALEILIGIPILCIVGGRAGDIPQFVLPNCGGTDQETELLEVIGAAATQAAVSRELVDST